MNPSPRALSPSTGLLQPFFTQLHHLQAQLVSGDAVALEQHTAALVRSLLDLAQQRPLPTGLQAGGAQTELRQLASQLTALREGLARRQAAVERELAIVVPATRTAVYGLRPGTARAAYASVRA